MGMRKGTGERKLILRGSLHASEEVKMGQSPPRIRKIIDYLRAPMEKIEQKQ